jgi:hypothetical protein|tara:strand:- start:322 stop:432 length:111 start_codon:yes stop_codon:yes gene_type:complete
MPKKMPKYRAGGGVKKKSKMRSRGGVKKKMGRKKKR